KAAAIGPYAAPRIRGSSVRLLADGRALPDGAPIPARTRRLDVQGLRAGRAEIDVSGKTFTIGAVELRAFDGDGQPVDLARSHASPQPTPPDRPGDDPFAPSGDPAAIRFVVVGPPDDIPPTLPLFSFPPTNLPIDALSDLPLAHVPCPAGTPADLT